ncbi:hypothetical protein FE257_008067 [Aspergillus nanangensis]|uniref:Alpha/beta hydrolase fold-3 domain-containing protein n=1 Tax=Aspergillus nanangensis TaxID=2582783 RepID=A0AAD4GTY0_ASPNN|nr:hypothetical protein FE257_008067 [Aspergillus nanangensis]
MVYLLQIVAENPIRLILFTYSFAISSLVAILERVLLPHYPVYQPLRIRLARAYFSAAATHIPRLVHRLPVTNCPPERALKQAGDDWEGYLIPALSGEATHPAQRESFLKAYQHVLRQGVPPSQVIFMGDSAGAAMAIMAALELPSRGLPSPSGSILISPWMDASLQSYEGGNPTMATDYVNTANTSVPMMFRQFLGDTDGKDPDANPLYQSPGTIHKAFLSTPQLILTGGAEMAKEDGRRWAGLCRQANVPYQLVLEWAQMHIYALGSRLDWEVFMRFGR